MAKKSTVENTTRTGSSVVTPNVPDFIQKPAENIAGGISGLVNQGPGAFTPQITDSQRGVWDQAKNLTGPDYSASNDLLNNGSSVAAGNVTGQSLLSGLEGYYNPFKDQITNPVLSDYDEQSGITRAGQSAEAARNRSFQGSRYGIQEAATEGQLARGRAATEGGLLKDMFTESTRLSGEDAGRRQAADVSNQQAALQASIANQNAEISRAHELGINVSNLDEAGRANLKLQGDLASDEADRLTQQQNWPIEYQKEMAGLLANLNPADYIGKTTNATDYSTTIGSSKSKASTGDWLGDAATAAAGSFRKG